MTRCAISSASFRVKARFNAAVGDTVPRRFPDGLPDTPLGHGLPMTRLALLHTRCKPAGGGAGFFLALWRLAFISPHKPDVATHPLREAVEAVNALAFLGFAVCTTTENANTPPALFGFAVEHH